MTGKRCWESQGVLSRVLDRGRLILLVAHELPRRLPAFAWMLLACLPGCATSGAVSIKDIRPEYLAQPARVVKTLDLTKLARPTEAQSKVQPGDVLEVTCYNLFEESSRERKETETFPVRVGSDGGVTLPLLSHRVPVGSLTVGEAEQVMRNAYRTSQLIKRPQLTVKVLEHKTNKIYVIGAVKKPGMYQLRPDHSDPLRAIAAAEGVTEEAGTVVEIRRTVKGAAEKPTASTSTSAGVAGVAWPPGNESVHEQVPETAPIMPVSWKAAPDRPHEVVSSAAANAEKTVVDEKIIRFDLTSVDIRLRPDQLALQNGDIVSVEQKKVRPFFVTGSVNKPGEFPMPLGRDIRVLEAIGLAGGVLLASDPNNALLTRRPERKNPIVIHIVLDRAARHPQENLSLVEGDVITVVEDAASQTRRAIRQFARFGIYPTR